MRYIDYPSTPEQAEQMIRDAIRYVNLFKATKLLQKLWWEWFKTGIHLRWLHLRYGGRK